MSRAPPTELLRWIQECLLVKRTSANGAAAEDDLYASVDKDGIKRQTVEKDCFGPQVCEKLRVMVKTPLRRYKYPPDRQEEATETVLRQAE